MFPHFDDIHSIRYLAAGDPVVFTNIYNRYSEKIYFFFLGKTKSAYIAEELLQQTFIKLWISRENLSTDFSIEIQLFRIGRSLLIDNLRKAATERNVLVSLQLTDTDNSTSLHLDAADTKKIVDDAIQQLPAVSRRIFQLNREEGLSYSEIAEMLSISPKTVEYHISKTLGILRKSLLAALLLLIR